MDQFVAEKRSVKGRLGDALPQDVTDRLKRARKLARYEKERLTWARRGIGEVRPIGTLLFWPDLPTHWHVIWKLAASNGYRITDDPSADVVAAVRFIDQTIWEPDEVLLDVATRVPVLNLNCSDIGKSVVSEANLRAFGRQLGVDPLTHKGTIVVKSEANATHDGVLVEGPITEIDPEMSYQRLIDNRLEDRGLFEVIRTPVIDGHVPLIYRKLRGGDNRLDNGYDDAQRHETSEYLNEEELAGIARFVQEMHMDHGEIDVLRDIAGDGQIYVVDANNTPWGPPRFLDETQRREAVGHMAPYFRRMIESRVAAMSGAS